MSSLDIETYCKICNINFSLDTSISNDNKNNEIENNSDIFVNFHFEDKPDVSIEGIKIVGLTN